MFKAFRTIPVILDIEKDIAELCPDAWLINFTNPAGMVTEALNRYGARQNGKYIGLCNVPIGMEKAAADVLNVKHEDLNMTFAGLNHMVFGTKVEVNGEDRTNDLIEALANGEIGQIVRNISDFSWNAEFIRGLGMMPCPYHKYYFQREKMLQEELKEFSKGQTRAEVVKGVEGELFELYKNPDLKEKPTQLEKRGGAYYSDAACRLITSIYNDTQDIQPVDFRNGDAISDIDPNSVVEVSCVITKEGPKPVKIGELPVASKGLIQEIKTFERLVVEAAVEGNVEKAILALTVNPLVASDSLAKVLVEELLEAHKDYLPQFKEYFERKAK